MLGDMVKINNCLLVHRYMPSKLYFEKEIDMSQTPLHEMYKPHMQLLN